ncbi:pilus assembly protein [Shewanella cyperi]|uniref:pilus assembly protein n=1 Tax=Shewanella cyperi TaxID=2814292 RepID=UPI001A93E290|nr:PilC/PilY family type IV pilus protein [Shewanella cyperi]QSX41649.1 type IV pilin biogenesis protein [Shewanella cyperi]
MIKKLVFSAIASLTVISGMSFGDDTELYLISSDVSTGKRPQVLFIFDNSGSMSTEDENTSSPYCSAADEASGTCNYATGFEEYLASYSGYINNKGIYWNAGGIDNGSMPTPDDPNDARRFVEVSNNCHQAQLALASQGRYTGYLWEFKSSGNTYEWKDLADNNGLNQKDIFDCYQDWTESDPENPGGNGSYADGYPANVKGGYVKDRPAKVGIPLGKPVTLYTPHYLVWYKWVTTTTAGQSSGGVKSRLDVAKEALQTALENLSIPIDAGLAVFNLNYPEEGYADGGRIVSAIKEMTATNRDSLISLINGMPAQTNTPLCETLYEAYLYFSGGAIHFGNKDANNAKDPKDRIDGYVVNNPPSIISSGNYTSPFKTCPDVGYVIYITDGAPTLDASADTLIQGLTANAKEKGDYSPFTYKDFAGIAHTSYLPALAAYMYNNDLVVGKKDASGVDNKQSVRLFTIGFSEGAEEAADLLEEAAFRGGNPRIEKEVDGVIEPGISTGYYVAKNKMDLASAMHDALKSILAIDSSFTSPSIASNNFDKTQTYNSAYYAMFLPSEGPRWKGNLKKLKVTSSGELVSPGPTANAIDDKGNIASSTCTFWNSCPRGLSDGNNVIAGGVLPGLQKLLKQRKILTNAGGGLTDIGSVSESTLYGLLGSPAAVSEAVAVQVHLDWLYGVDVGDDDRDLNITEAREDIMGDPLHSKPLAINFGPSTTSLDVRVLVGTNQGLLHMFKDSDTGSGDYSVGSVEESWAFLPAELIHNIPTLKENTPTGSHDVYGMDSSPVAYTETNSSGAVTKAWVYVGMRRGGASYYALDITKPDAPALGWVINSDKDGFTDLGQTWSEPVVTTVPGIDGPVVIFGGGYSDAKYGSGQAVYIANAFTGDLVRKFSAIGMDAVPNKVAVLDSNNDGTTDRIYATDISGNIWRMDLASKTSTEWTVFKFASIASAAPNDRMFFAEPTVAQTQFTNLHKEGETITYQTIPYDAVTVGSGNRTHPLDTNTVDMFYVFQDRNVVSEHFSSDAPPTTLTLSDLYNVTSAAPSTDAENVDFGTKKGWYYDFTMAGEKTLSASLIFDGKVYFTSFIPPSGTSVDIDAGICGLSGQGRLYVFDLHKGTRTYSHVYYELGERVPDTPQIVIPAPENGEEPKAYIIGVGKGEADESGQYKGTINIGTGLNANKIYFHIDE